MTKSEIAGILEQIATLLELKGENPFKIRAYTNAARAIETLGANIPDLQDEEAVAKIPGIGKSVALKIKELAGTGSLKYLEDLRAQFPEAILELFSVPGLGAKKISALYERLHVSSIEQLQQACQVPTPTPTGTPRPVPTLRPLRKFFKNCKKHLDALLRFSLQPCSPRCTPTLYTHRIASVKLAKSSGTNT